MKARVRAFMTLALLGVLLDHGAASGQRTDEPGRPIGRVTTRGDLIVLELNEGALGRSDLFDLAGRTLRFVPRGAGYRVENGPLRWDGAFGAPLAGSEVRLRRFAFPFSGRRWSSFDVGATGSIRFGEPGRAIARDPYGKPEGGISLDRFDTLAVAAGRLADSVVAICVFLKPRLSGPRYVKELRDRVVITWNLTEPYGGLLDFTWVPTVNRFQAVLHRDGTIEMSYREVAARDAIVGVYPRAATGSPGPVPPTDLSAATLRDAPRPIVYEAFHYPGAPRPQDLACSVITALGDRFDFLAYYSDFRIDSQEGSSPSFGPAPGEVTGIGQTPSDPATYCSKGRFQWALAQPISVGANEMQPGPPPGAPAGGPHDLAFYESRLAAATADGRPLPYDYAVGHLGHEMAHRWGAYVAAQVGGERIPLGPWPHWDPGLQAPVAFPYELPVEASTLGGGVWQDNSDGTYTRLHDGFFVPATGYSHLDLYLMGFLSAAEVPDFFLLRQLQPAGRDAQGRARFRAARQKLTIADVIAAEGPRQPDYARAQRRFTTGIVVVTEHGVSPSPAILERANGIARQWVEYWARVTGFRSAMTVIH